jgi:hypothetical protein
MGNCKHAALRHASAANAYAGLSSPSPAFARTLTPTWQGPTETYQLILLLIYQRSHHPMLDGRRMCWGAQVVELTICPAPGISVLTTAAPPVLCTATICADGHLRVPGQIPASLAGTTSIVVIARIFITSCSPLVQLPQVGLPALAL